MVRKMEEMEQRNELIEKKKKKEKNRKAAESAAIVEYRLSLWYDISFSGPRCYDAAADRREQLLPMVGYTCVVPFYSRCDRFSNQRK